MKRILLIIILLSGLTISGQVHQFGLGVGQGDGIDDPKFEGFYSFNYKLLYTKLNYIYTPTSAYEYKRTSQTALFLGIQSHPDFKLIGHIDFGARAYFPTKNDSYPTYRPQDESQINLFFNTGASYEIVKHHCLYFDIYIGGVRREVYKRNYIDTETSSDFMMTIGYIYTFRIKKKSDNQTK